MATLNPRKPSSTHIRSHDHRHFPSFAAALPAVAEEHPALTTPMSALYAAVNSWLKREGRPTVPFGSFVMLTRALGYATTVVDGTRQREVHRLVLKAR